MSSILDTLTVVKKKVESLDTFLKCYHYYYGQTNFFQQGGM